MNTERNNGLNKLRGIGCLALIGCMILTASLAAGAEDLSAWQKRMPIAFSGYTPSGGSETLTNFPVLVVLSNSTAGVGFDYTDFQSPPYGDLRFAAADKTTPLDFEVELWDTNGLSYVWVRVPELAPDMTIYALWGKSSVSVPPSTTNGVVWEEGFAGVWHLKESAFNYADSTTNNHPGSSGTVPTSVAGIVDGAQSFNRVAKQYVDVGSPVIADSQFFTISAWVKPDSGGTAVGRGRDGNGAGWSVQLNASLAGAHNAYVVTTSKGAAAYQAVGTTIGSTDRWDHLTAVWKPQNGGLFFYVNGRLEGVNATTTYTLRSSTVGLRLGRVSDGYYSGQLDEVQVSHLARSTNWIWATYLNMASNDVFAVYGDPESQDLPAISPGGGATNVTSTSAWLNGTLSSTGTSDTAVFAYWGTTDGGTNASAWANTNTWAASQMPGVFTVQATGLSPNSTYCCRFAASNAAGSAWAAEASVFITGDVWVDKLSDASEVDLAPGTFTVHRASAVTNEALIVTYTISGTATPGVDYVALSGTVTIPKGEDSVMIEVIPIFDHFVEETETVEVTLVLGPYVIGITSNATVEIVDYGVVARTWGGGGANSFASNPDNWVEGEAPIAGDAIVLGTNTSKNMIWDLNLPVQSWTQDGYTGTVTIATVYPGQGAFTNFTILGDCVISNGVWTHEPNPSTVTYVNNELYRLHVTVGGDLIIGAAGQITVDFKGYTNQRGPGYGNVGGSHGGQGNQGIACYGSLVAPTNLGSAGTYDPGGGAIRLSVEGMVTNAGLISANGRGSGGRSGAGGSIMITSGTLTGGGAIRADGGGTANSGGGGRIALTVTHASANFALYSGPIQCLGGGPGTGNGTIYLREAGEGLYDGTLVLHNNNVARTRYAQIAPLVTDTVVRNVVIRNSGRFQVEAGQTLTVSGMWSNNATFLASADSTVIFERAPNGTNALYGSSTFVGFVCTNAGQTLMFETGKTTTVNGELRLIGFPSATNLFLRSSVSGTAWNLNVGGLTAQNISNVDVQDSDAGAGTEVAAFFSKDSGNNVKWNFSDYLPGITNVWTGAASTLWSVGANWNSGRAPVDEDSMRIPSGMPNAPCIDGQSRTMAGLEIESGANLSLNGFNLTVTEEAVVAGALVCAGGETVTIEKDLTLTGTLTAVGAAAFVLKGDVDFAGGTFVPAVSTVTLVGAVPQSFDPANQTFHRLVAANSIVFHRGFLAYEWLCEPGVGQAFGLTFDDGETVTVNRMALLSEPGYTNITLRSSTDGQAWFLDVATYHSVRGVDVKDSHATGESLHASGSYDAGNNDRWDFDANWSEWTGQAGNGLFMDQNNWWPAVIPASTSWVRLDKAGIVTLAAPVTLGRLTVGCGTPASTFKVNAALAVAGDVVVGNNGTLEWNRPGMIGGSVQVLAGGVLTHDVNADTEVNKLMLTVDGDVFVETNGVIDVTAKGYGTGRGPGYANPGASYGGRGTGGAACYGCILAPTNLGSGGTYDPGGGLIWLEVAGTITNAGLIVSDGRATSRSGAGGTIRLVAGALTGNGLICANGGAVNPGGGGRISLTVTNAGADFVPYGGAIEAFGPSAAGAGMIYYQAASDLPGRGTVEVNDTSTVGITPVPPTLSPDVREAQRASFRINAARLQLTDNFEVGDIWLDTANAVLDLGGYTLTVNAREHELGLGTVVNYGKIVWTGLPPGVLIIVK